MTGKKYYVVWQGRKKGIFTTWAECKKQVEGFAGARYKSFTSKEEAEKAFADSWVINPSNPIKSTSEDNTKSYSSQIITPSICVDAACAGNPGKMEYQGVCTVTKKVLFHQKPLDNGTNNLGEFLAIVHGLKYLQGQNQTVPIYSDSAIAILWVKNKTVKTTLKQDYRNREIFELLNSALIWLQENKYSNKILKWDTKMWGEIPADFGRKK